ncbi:Thiamine-monophosphate kinase [Methanosarcinaceae archaeon Ag5]|uniref:Thiamine-monophosphate kinase n=1 Tax=Methanolapillus africanus TaxID=3028297 RepID=A0AAE4SG19_9EURY|nr:Thiamine-monophosphate kinase [Methanosarcinaceae archaeon Ag5]
MKPSASDSDGRKITEKELIDVFSDVFRFSKKPILSGSEFDDCAAVRFSFFTSVLGSDSDNADLLRSTSLLFSTDTVHRKSDFPPSMSPWQIGWMSAAVNLSDIAGMGGKPVAFLVSIGLSADFSLNDARELALGINDCVSMFGAEVIGGDTEFHDELTITGTVIGVSENKHVLYRNGAKPGDLLCVTGFAGSAGVALDLLLNDPSFQKAGVSINSVSPAFLKNLTEPYPRVFEGRALSKTGAVTSMMDTSDGLAASVHELSERSCVGFVVDAEKVPTEGEAFQILSQVCPTADSAKQALFEKALYTGGDYELLFTVSPDKLKAVEAAFEQLNQQLNQQLSRQSNQKDGGKAFKSGKSPSRFTVIGEATKDKSVLLKTESKGQIQLISLLKKGYDQFDK